MTEIKIKRTDAEILLDQLFHESDEEILKTHRLTDLQEIFRKVYGLEPIGYRCSTKKQILLLLHEYLDNAKRTDALIRNLV